MVLKNLFAHIMMVATLFYKTDDTKKQTSKQPNIIYIFADDLGYNDVGYHRSEIKTPNIDRLAREGVRLENYYVQPICSPSRSQFMSGRYQIHTGLQHGVIKPCQPNALPTTSPTVADKLKEVGYRTHAIGKWHLGFYKDKFLPVNRGFDTFFGFYTGAEDYYDHRRCFEYCGCGYDLHDNKTSVFNETGQYSTHLFTERAINIVKNHDQSKPMFMYLAYQAVHSPLQAPRRYIRPYYHIQDKSRRIYAGMVSCLDEGIGNLTDALKEVGMWENTVFVFSTDNGGSIADGGNNWPLRGWKGSLWEGGMRGVGFVTSSKLKNPGTVNYEFIHVSDWYLTFLSIAGAKRNGTKNMDGFNQWLTISELAPSPRKELLHNIDSLTMKQGKRLYQDTFDNRIRAAIRVNNWKLITGTPGNSSWIPPPHISRQLDPRSRYQSDSVFELSISGDGSADLGLSSNNAIDLNLPDNSQNNFIMDLPHTTRHDYIQPEIYMKRKNNREAKNIWLFNIADDPYEEIDLSNTHIDIVRSLLDRLLEYQKTEVPIRYPPYDPESNPQKHGGQWNPWK